MENISFDEAKQIAKRLLTPEKEEALQSMFVERATRLTGLQESHMNPYFKHMIRHAVEDVCRMGILDPAMAIHRMSDAEIIRNATIDETYFFRSPCIYDALEKLQLSPKSILILPCATGEEAYSYRMLYPAAQRVDAYDVDPISIETAKQGVFESRDLHRVISGSALHARYHERFIHSANFQAVENGYRVKETVGPINFQTMSIFDVRLKHDTKKWDLISCLNFFIYLDPEQQQYAMNLLISKLNPGGTLVWNGSKHDITMPAGWHQPTTHSRDIYQKTDPNITASLRERKKPDSLAEALRQMREQTAALGRACAELRTASRAKIV